MNWSKCDQVILSSRQAKATGMPQDSSSTLWSTFHPQDTLSVSVCHRQQRSDFALADSSKIHLRLDTEGAETCFSCHVLISLSWLLPLLKKYLKYFDYMGSVGFLQELLGDVLFGLQGTWHMARRTARHRRSFPFPPASPSSKREGPSFTSILVCGEEGMDFIHQIHLPRYIGSQIHVYQWL